MVSSETESDPCSGSVSANAPIFSSRAIGPQPALLLLLRPDFAIAFIASPACTARKVPRLPSPRLISMWIRPADSGSIGGQP